MVYPSIISCAYCNNFFTSQTIVQKLSTHFYVQLCILGTFWSFKNWILWKYDCSWSVNVPYFWGYAYPWIYVPTDVKQRNKLCYILTNQAVTDEMKTQWTNKFYKINNKRPMVNIAHLRNQFKTIKTFTQIYEIYHNID